MYVRAATLFLLVVIACSSKEKELRHCDPTNPSCGEGEACEAVVGTDPACFPALHVVGTVFDALDPAAKLGGARVVAFDVGGYPVSRAAVTAGSGQYDLVVRATRDTDGNPVASATAMLRADSQGYFSFPSGLLTSLPIELTRAVNRDGSWVLDAGVTSLVNVGLLADATAGPKSISGSVAPPPSGGGVLVAAEEAGGEASSAWAASDGTFVIYDLPAGQYVVRAYTTGVVYSDAFADLTTAGSVSGLQLDLDGTTQTGTVSGNLQFENVYTTGSTSVILFVKSTFDQSILRGEAPPGLRADGLTGGNFSVAGVPPGDYVVLAAHESDGLMRDPDPAISGTQIPLVTVDPGAESFLNDSVKITSALEVLSPGANGLEVVSSAPVLSWVDDSSEDWYEVTLLNALGETVWLDTVPSYSGTSNVTYDGVTYLSLVPGMTYQFTVVSMEDCSLLHPEPPYNGACPLSTTEDLEGVFVYEP